MSKNKKRILLILEDNYQYVFTDLSFINSTIYGKHGVNINEKIIKKHLLELRQKGYVKTFKNHIGGTSYTITEKFIKEKNLIFKKNN